jgi:quercetin dioxygenase-like cupin family protein
MIVDKATNVTYVDVQEENISGVRMRILMSEKNGAPNFTMRVFDIAQGGHTAYHTHEWEHEVYVLAGSGAVRHGDTEHEVGPGSYALVPSGEKHQFMNKGPDTFSFICVVPNRS